MFRLSQRLCYIVKNDVHTRPLKSFHCKPIFLKNIHESYESYTEPASRDREICYTIRSIVLKHCNNSQQYKYKYPSNLDLKDLEIARAKMETFCDDIGFNNFLSRYILYDVCDEAKKNFIKSFKSLLKVKTNRIGKTHVDIMYDDQCCESGCKNCIKNII